MFIDKVLATTLGAVFLLVLACEGPATEKNDDKDTAVVKTLKHEPAFWDYAASSNMLQIEIAKVAAGKGATEQTRSMAREALAYHKQALTELKNLAQKHNNIQLPDKLTGADLGLVEEFKLLEGKELDIRFREFVLSTHNAQLNRYAEALTKAEDQGTRDWLADMRVHLQDEISRINTPAPAEIGEEDA
ncbi:DUF4142 domain-containing protein [Pontibacter korlensis]|uniref:DUF4142 domain-containing protein n=1 Tax=Pontibacter korlensis TaxID=400092 RepID=A0A0E3UVI7_9BACT|nr:DUF4142 domain-containing protein [Pontibacter korlensis]AKD02562.1 hypothetical protein PKOR_04785 [Pontibacter korlensis]